ncbi:DUF4340 domain-containing protein [candidate division KSB1 bacterium]|nr:DUF4340 domain-containing protein [candidate division KSB1 bacterium]
MNFKTTGILALVLCIGIAAVLLLNKQDKKKEESEKIEGKLLNIEVENISEIILQPSGIRCRKDSTEWKIIAPIETDGDKSSIEAIGNMFGWAKIERTISSDPLEYAEYGLDPAMGELILIHKDGTDTLYLGDKSPTGSYVFARKSGSPDVFLTTTSLQSNIEKTLFDLRDKKVVGFDKAQVRAFDLTNRKGSFTLEKEAGEWKIRPGDYAADESEVDKVLNRLNSERAKEFVDEDPKDLAAYGLIKPVAQVDLLLGENRAKKTLLIGKLAGDKYYAKDESRKPVFQVDSAFVTILNPDLYTLRLKDLADFSSSDVNRFELAFSGQEIICTKDTSGTWMLEQPESRKAKSWKVSSITREASQLEVVEFVDDRPASLAPYGLSAPQVRAKFFVNDVLELDVSLGAEKGDNVYATVAGSPAVYLVEKTLLETWMPRIEDIAEEPEETPADTSADTSVDTSVDMSVDTVAPAP